MTGDESGTIRETSRRMLLRNALLVGAGAAAVGVTSISQAGSAYAASAPVSRAQLAPLAAPGADVPIQWSWAWCSKCQGLYYIGMGTGGFCPAGGHHGGAKSYNYGLYYAGEGSDYQGGWAFCSQCDGLFYANGEEFAGLCPKYQGAAAHANTNSYDYIVFYGPGSYTDSQPGWRWCWQCQGMFYANNNTRAGVCPLDNGRFLHNGSSSYLYQMIDNQ
jgi:hypothetical protein